MRRAAIPSAVHGRMPARVRSALFINGNTSHIAVEPTTDRGVFGDRDGQTNERDPGTARSN